MVNASAGQEWIEYGCEPLNLKVIDIMQDEDIEMTDKCGNPTGEIQNLEILRSLSTGKTLYSVAFAWNGMVLRKVEIEIYVNMVVSLAVFTPREDVEKCLQLRSHIA